MGHCYAPVEHVAERRRHAAGWSNSSGDTAVFNAAGGTVNLAATTIVAASLEFDADG